MRRLRARVRHLCGILSCGARRACAGRVHCARHRVRAAVPLRIGRDGAPQRARTAHLRAVRACVRPVRGRVLAACARALPPLRARVRGLRGDVPRDGLSAYDVP
ncbi:hypothetical protein F01_530088 [Burkholderia cenocepacia]|nr:hypothetical protein F01_530088 [Burkholderia cenocepacia]